MNPGNRTVKMLLAVLLGAFSAAPALRALDFTPEFVTTVTEDGFKSTEIILRDTGSRVIYCPPSGWQAVEGERQLRFHPASVSLADLTIDSEKAAVGRSVDAAAIERCRAWLKASIPAESSDIEVEADEANPGAVANCPTFGTTIAYTIGGVRYRKRTVFVFAYDANIRFTTAARIADFDRLYPVVRRSLFSWRWEKQ
jgi:hypothetical protein